MRLATLTASTAALLLSSTALMAQEATTSSDMGTMNNAYIDVGGTAYEVPVSLAAQACGMEEQQVMDMAASMQNAAGMGTTDTAAADAGAATGEMATGDMAAADAGAAGDMATADAGAATDTTGTDMSGTLETAETTAAADAGGAASGGMATEVGSEYLSQVVCQVDAEQAASLGIGASQ